MPAAPAPLERVARRLVRWGRAVPGLRRLLLWPAVARPGYWFATLAGLFWGGILSRARLSRAGGMIVAAGCPRWAFGRGGTTIGAVYLTHDTLAAPVLEHEAIHRAQWKRYGLAFIALYLAAGPIAEDNRFEVEAGLEKGGYR